MLFYQFDKKLKKMGVHYSILTEFDRHLIMFELNWNFNMPLVGTGFSVAMASLSSER